MAASNSGHTKAIQRLILFRIRDKELIKHGFQVLENSGYWFCIKAVLSDGNERIVGKPMKTIKEVLHYLEDLASSLSKKYAKSQLQIADIRARLEEVEAKTREKGRHESILEITSITIATAAMITVGVELFQLISNTKKWSFDEKTAPDINRKEEVKSAEVQPLEPSPDLFSLECDISRILHYKMSLEPGVHLISLPLYPIKKTVSDMFCFSGTARKEYLTTKPLADWRGGEYRYLGKNDVLTVGRGYFVTNYTDSNLDVTVAGYLVRSYERQIKKGWHFIGGITKEGTIDMNYSLLTSGPWEFSYKEYKFGRLETRNLKPCKGYAIQVNKPTRIHIRSATTFRGGREPPRLIPFFDS